MADMAEPFDMAGSCAMLIKRCGKLISLTTNQAFQDAGYEVTGGNRPCSRTSRATTA